MVGEDLKFAFVCWADCSNSAYNIHKAIQRFTKIVSDVIGVPLKKIYVSRKKGDLNLTHPSIKEMENLGWIPKVDLRDGVEWTLDWILDEGIESFIY